MERAVSTSSAGMAGEGGRDVGTATAPSGAGGAGLERGINGSERKIIGAHGKGADGEGAYGEGGVAAQCYIALQPIWEDERVAADDGNDAHLVVRRSRADAERRAAWAARRAAFHWSDALQRSPPERSARRRGVVEATVACVGSDGGDG